MAHAAALTAKPLQAELRDLVGRLLGIGKVRDDLAMSRTVEAGLPVAAVGSLLKHGIPESFVFAAILPKRTYQRRRELKEPLTPDESDRTERVARALALATVIFDDEERSVRWLASPKPEFGDRAPLELLRTKIGTDIVERALLRAYYGFAA